MPINNCALAFDQCRHNDPLKTTLACATRESQEREFRSGDISSGFSTASSTLATAMRLPNRSKSLNVQTTFLSGVTSMICGLSAPRGN